MNLRSKQVPVQNQAVLTDGIGNTPENMLISSSRLTWELKCREQEREFSSSHSTSPESTYPLPQLFPGRQSQLIKRASRRDPNCPSCLRRNNRSEQVDCSLPFHLIYCLLASISQLTAAVDSSSSPFIPIVDCDLKNVALFTRLSCIAYECVFVNQSHRLSPVLQV